MRWLTLSRVISLAFYSAKKEYIIYREFLTDKGFADIVFIPKKSSEKPAIVVALKWDKTTNGAIKQIKNINYTNSIKDYSGEIILLG